MKTIALRFGETFAPEGGTIQAHQQLINENGYVWYGKFGAPVSSKVLDALLKSNNSKILLINSGKADRYWAYITDVTRERPQDGYPQYYGEFIERMRTWFKIVKFEEAPRDILSNCLVASSHRPLSQISKYSMSPYFIIDYVEEEEA